MYDWNIASYRDRIKNRELENKSLIRLDRGEPDFDTPDPIKRAAIDALRAGLTKYIEPVGLLQLREGISNYHNLSTKKDISTNNVIVTPGSKFAVFLALSVLLRRKEIRDVLFFDPYWMDYANICQILCAKFTTIPLVRDGEKFTFEEEKVKEIVHNGSNAFIINSPHHPTGKVFSEKEIKFITDIAHDCKVHLISDEIYDKINFGTEIISPLKFAETLEKISIINGFSKTFAMAGLRLGYCITNKSIIQDMVKLQSQTVTCANSIAQYAAVEALKLPAKYVSVMVEEYKRRSHLLQATLNDLGKVSCPKAEGTFYLFADFSQIGLEGQTIVDELLDYDITALPGFLFGKGWEKYVRFAVTTSFSEVKRSRTNFEAWLKLSRF
jgi:aspartate aminotransferase